MKVYDLMKVGDLVKWRHHVALVVAKDEWATMVRWVETGETEDAAYYGGYDDAWEFVNES